MRKRLILAAALMLAAPAVASAQFTTVVAPPRPAEPARSAQVVAEDRARADSIQTARIANMREWVDSAAVAIAARPDSVVVVDTAAGEVVLSREPDRRPSPEPTRAFREGARAPETATGLPLLALAGIGILGVGALLLGKTRG